MPNIALIVVGLLVFVSLAPAQSIIVGSNSISHINRSSIVFNPQGPHHCRIYHLEERRQNNSDLYYAIPGGNTLNMQWNLLNTGQCGIQYTGNDLKVEPAWLHGWTGCNITVSVVDDGINYCNPDLLTNFVPSISYDYIHNDPDPFKSSNHGTQCSAIIAGSSNATCAIGIAYECNLGSIRVNYEQNDDIEIAKALSHALEVVDIYSNSWGPGDNGSHVGGPGPLTKTVLKRGTHMGRGGKGSIYVFSNGNGGLNDDDCGADGYATSIYTISVGTLQVNNQPAPTDEQCSAKMTVVYVADAFGANSIHTTSTLRDCDVLFGDSSAAAPMVSGIIALSLEANPTLTWRDVQYLIVYTANPNLTADHLTRNGAGLIVSRQHGFGLIDAEAMVTRAKHWINVPPQIEDTHSISIRKLNSTTPYTLLTSYTGQIHYLEHVVVKLDVEVPENSDGINRGDLQIELHSPSGTKSVLLHNRSKDIIPGKYSDWPFMSVMFWGENATGQWNLTITAGESSVGIVSSVEFIFYGVSIKPAAVAKMPRNCDPQCVRGCANEGPQFCDSCKKLRNAHTLECIDSDICPSHYEEHNGYCYNASIPYKECHSPLKSSRLVPEQKGCADFGYTQCYGNSSCQLPAPHKCFCDKECFKFKDCCHDVAPLNSSENDFQVSPYIELEATPDIATHNIGSGEFSSPINASFPFGITVEPRIYVSRDGYFRFSTNPTKRGREVVPFFNLNNLSTGSVMYEIHKRDTTSNQLMLLDSIISENGYANFSSKWMLVATWNDVSQIDTGGKFTNIFQGILVTDYLRSYAVFIYRCGDLSFSNPGEIGYNYTEINEVIKHGATYRDHPYFISCYNQPDTEWVNIVYEIAISDNECEENNGGCQQICTETFLAFTCSCEEGYILNDDDSSCSDIDECMMSLDDCEQHCSNTPGSYECYCTNGYIMGHDQQSCEALFDSSQVEYLQSVDDGISKRILLTRGFPLGQTLESTVYVGTNGYFTFTRFTGFTPFPFSSGTGLSIVAPFFSDIDISHSGTIRYQVHNNLTNTFISLNAAETINALIIRNKLTNFSTEWLLVASWDNVPFHGIQNIEVSFQGIIVTDYNTSFAIFSYQCDKRISQTIANSATVGYVTKDGQFFNHDATFQSNPYVNVCSNSYTRKTVVYELK